MTGLATSQIRFYEASRLICAVKRKTDNCRDYTPDAVVTLEIIKSAQRSQFGEAYDRYAYQTAALVPYLL